MSALSPAQIVSVSERPSKAYIADEFDRQLWSDLRAAAFVLAILYVLFAIAHPFTVGGSAGWKLTSLALASAATMLIFGFRIRHSESYRLANPFAALFAAIVLANSAFHLYLTGNPEQFTNFIVLVVAVGSFFLSLRWLVGTIMGIGIVWMVMLRAENIEQPVHYVFAFVTASVVAALSFRFRTKALCRAIIGTWSEARHREQLELAEVELMRANSELEQRVEQRGTELQRQVEQTLRMEQAVYESEKLATTGRMAATLAHEINNPLDSIVNCLYLLEEANLTSGERKYLELAVEELQRVVRITRHTLSFYRKGESPASFDCSELASEVVSTFRPMAAGRGIHLDSRIQGGHRIEGYAGEIRQLLTNLLINAMDAGASRIRVRVTTSTARGNPSSQGLRISVTDDGKGIPASDAPNLFEPFFTTKGEKGTGLGLWVCKGIVQKHHGTIKVRSIVRSRVRGSAFSVFIPSVLAIEQETVLR